MNLHEWSDEELLRETSRLVGSHREITARLVAHLGEVEERRLHLAAGYGSMFEFCVKALRLSEGEAFRRLVAARLGRRFPVVHSLLASGEVHLSALELLRDHLTEENHDELLDAASGKSKREVEAMLAARFPKPDVASRIRKLHERALIEEQPVTGAARSTGAEAFAPSSQSPIPSQSRGRIEPLSEARYRVEFTASAGLREKLELCRDLMSHANPSRDVAVVVERAVDLLLAELRKRRLGAAKQPKRVSASRSVKRGRVTRATRREVYERDGLRCTYVSPDGRRCESRAFLELDHVDPKALGGADGADNIRIRCRAHNQLEAERAFGRDVVETAKHFRQRKWRRRQCEEVEEGEGARDGRDVRVAEETSPLSVVEKVRFALKGMGFRDREVGRAIAEVAKVHAETGLPDVEQVLREAVLVATAGNRGRRDAA